ncbi:hypothetical protein FGB62_50g222 [Gracilaria domingensis]|nr:hypothetical protein FGB62_50g222 [Gracilaria domingensis]
MLCMLLTASRDVLSDPPRALNILKRAIGIKHSSIEVFRLAMEIDYPKIFLDVYSTWKDARRSEEYAQCLTSPQWQADICGKYDCFTDAASQWQCPSQEIYRPNWNFLSRFGSSWTFLNDLRLILIGVKFEDWYEPDFYIYNDVIEWKLGQNPQFYCYPENNFPPTNIHATVRLRDGHRLVKFESLGYADKGDAEHI